MGKKYFYMTVCLATMSLAACASSPQAIQTAIAQTQSVWTLTPTTTVTPTSTQTPLPTSTATPRPTPGVLYYDDFSNSQSGWANSTLGSGAHYAFLDGQYVISISELMTYVSGGYYYWSIANRGFSDAVLTVDTSIVKGNGEEGGPVVIWRYVNEDNYYMLRLNGKGYLAIVKIIKDESEILYRYTFSDVINQGQQINKIAISFIGDISKIYVNDKFMTSIQDSAFTTGDIGLGAASNETSALEISFDNLVVYAVDSWTPPKQ
jgi:hypothetical protein